MRTEELVFRLGELCLPRAAGEVRALGAGGMGSFWGCADFFFEGCFFFFPPAGAASAALSAAAALPAAEMPARREKREGGAAAGAGPEQDQDHRRQHHQSDDPLEPLALFLGRLRGCRGLRRSAGSVLRRVLRRLRCLRGRLFAAALLLCLLLGLPFVCRRTELRFKLCFQINTSVIGEGALKKAAFHNPALAHLRKTKKARTAVGKSDCRA